MVPLVKDDAEAELLARLRQQGLFPLGPDGRWQCFGVAELHETNDRSLWRDATEGRPLWKGESFDQYAPNGYEARACPMTEAVLRKIRKPRPGGDSLVAEMASVDARRKAVLRELERARLAFRGISRATDSRTVRACLVPPGYLLANSAPYLAFTKGGPLDQMACLAIMNSLPFDWQTRRFAEANLNFFILEGMCVPPLSDEAFAVIANAAARLSCVDERFADSAEANGIEYQELTEKERETLRLEIDARVSYAWSLSQADLQLILRDFSLDAVPSRYRDRLLARVAAL